MIVASSATNAVLIALGPAGTPPNVLGRVGLEVLPMHEREHADWLDRVLEILRERFCEPLTMAQVAREVGVHRVYLSAAFRKRYGCTARDFVRALRIDLARERFLHSEDTLRRIASACGFYDQGAFTKTFKQETGLTPGAYRLTFRHSIKSSPTAVATLPVRGVVLTPVKRPGS
jgi:AraC-like DNA-binding protein